jgi:hypothetical protein
MTISRHVFAGALALALLACGKVADEEDEFRDAVPDAAGLTLELQGGTTEAALASAPEALEASDLGAGGDDLAVARERLRQLNAAVGGVLVRVDELIGAQPTTLPGDVRMFGPANLPAGATPAATFRLTVRKKAPGRFGFLVDAKPVNTADSAYVHVAAGEIVRGVAARRGRGTIGIDADALHAVNGLAFPATGKLLASFAHTGARGKALAYRLLAFDADGAGTTHAPVTAKLVGHRHSVTGVTRVRLAALDDLVGPNSASPFHDELVFAHFGWSPALGKARAYTVATNWVDGSSQLHGDVTPIGSSPAFWIGRACWQGNTKHFQEWFKCSWGQPLEACALQIFLAPTSERYVKDSTLLGSSGTWQQACQGVELDAPPDTSGPSPVDDNAESGVEADPGEPPARMPANTTSP